MTTVMTAGRLRELCQQLRGKAIACDDAIVTAVEADLEQYRLEQVEQVPPAHMAELLPLMGWLIYEMTWSSLQQIPAGFRQFTGEALVDVTAHFDRIARTTNAARNMPWPEYAARALGAFRSQALAESKRDTQEGYERARIVHLEARNRHASFLMYHKERNAAETDPHLRALDEILLQLVLAETGTACRVAERVIGRWAEELQPDDEAEAKVKGEERAQLMFDQLAHGVDIGEQALAAADRVKANHGFVDAPSEAGLALPTSFLNPAVMTARALLLMLGLYPEMERAGRYPLDDDETWDDTRERLKKRFLKTYEYIERPIESTDGRRLEPRDDIKLAIVQVRLNAALLMPGLRLPSSLTFAPCLAHEVLDDEAIDAMCAWMAETSTDPQGKTTQRGVHRGFGSATMPDFIRGVEACRAGFGAGPGYRQWRTRWFVLDDYAKQSGRAQRVSQALGRPVQQPAAT